MKSIILASILLICLTNSVMAQTKSKIKGSGSIVTQTLAVGSFDQIESNVSADVEITKGPVQKVVVEGQQNIIDLIQTEVKDKKWRIKLDRSFWADYEKLTIRITVPELIGVGLSGSGSVVTTNTFKAQDFQVGLSGSGKIKLMVDAENLDCGLSGSGNIYLTGGAKELNIGTSGSGGVIAKDFPVNRVKIGISGSGDCEVNATEALEAGIAGSGSIRYHGSPKVKTSISGSGSIRSID